MSQPDLSILCDLLNDAFDLEGLTGFCFFRFRPVYDQFQETDRKNTRIRLLVEHAERYGQLVELVEHIKAENVHQYERYAGKLFKPVPIPAGHLLKEVTPTEKPSPLPNQIPTTPTPVWTTNLGKVKIEALTASEGVLVVAAQNGEQIVLLGRDLTDGQPCFEARFDQVQVTGITPVLVPAPPTAPFFIVSLSNAIFMGQQAAVRAIDSTGQELWHFSLVDTLLVSAPALAGETVWVTTNTGRLVGLDLYSGEVRSDIMLEITPAPAAPLIHSAMAYIPSRGPRLAAVSLAKPSARFFETPDPPQILFDTTPVISNSHLVTIANLGGAVQAFRLSNGQPAWRTALGPKQKTISPLTSHDRRLFVGTRQGLHALNATDGTLLWQADLPRGIETAAVVDKGEVYAACRDAHLRVFSATSGRPHWHYPLAKRPVVPPLLVRYQHERYVILADREGTVIALK